MQVEDANMFMDKCDGGLVAIESSGTELEKQNESSSFENDTRAEGADISNDIEQVNEDAEQRLNKCPFRASVFENKITESLNKTLESEKNLDLRWHMTVTRINWRFEEFNGGSVTFGGSKATITKQLVLLAISLIGLDTLSVLGNLDGNPDEVFLVDKPNVKGVGYRWMFDIDYLTDSMNYIPVSLENQANPQAGASEVTNRAAVKNTEEKVESRKKWISDRRMKNQVKNDKTEHGMEKRGKDKVKSKPKTKKVKVKSQPTKVNSPNRADIEEYLMGPPEPI
ncbi:hypothetical protein Tco_1203715 [Tanacetum coccineum]